MKNPELMNNFWLNAHEWQLIIQRCSITLSSTEKKTELNLLNYLVKEKVYRLGVVNSVTIIFSFQITFNVSNYFF